MNILKKNMKNIVLIIVLIFSNLICIAQNNADLSFQYFDRISQPERLQKSKKARNTLNNNPILYAFLDSIIYKLPDPPTNVAEFKSIKDDFFPTDKANLDLEDKAIVLIKHPYEYDENGDLDEEIEKSLESFILHKENEKWSNYLLETKEILVIIIGGENTLQNGSISIEKLDNFFKQSAKDLNKVLSLAVAGGTVDGAIDKPATIPIQIARINRNAIKSPCNIVMNFAQSDSPSKIKIHERNNFAFQVGVAGNLVNRRNFSLQDQQLTVNLDDDQKEEWKANLMVQLMWSPWGRDIDRLDIIKLSIFKKLGEELRNRVGVFGGAKLSSDPLQNLALGLNFAVSKDFYINVGRGWNRLLVPGTTNVGEIDSVKDAVKYAREFGNTKYEKGFYLGLSFSPTTIFKALGGGEEEKKD